MALFTDDAGNGDDGDNGKDDDRHDGGDGDCDGDDDGDVVMISVLMMAAMVMNIPFEASYLVPFLTKVPISIALSFLALLRATAAALSASVRRAIL